MAEPSERRSVDGEHMAHVIDEDGVAEARFVRSGSTYTNADEICLSRGAVLDFGNGMTITNGQTFDFTFTLDLEP